MLRRWGPSSGSAWWTTLPNTASWWRTMTTTPRCAVTFHRPESLQLYRVLFLVLGFFFRSSCVFHSLVSCNVASSVHCIYFCTCLWCYVSGCISWLHMICVNAVVQGKHATMRYDAVIGGTVLSGRLWLCYTFWVSRSGLLNRQHNLNLCRCCWMMHQASSAVWWTCASQPAPAGAPWAPLCHGCTAVLSPSSRTCPPVLSSEPELECQPPGLGTMHM